MWLFYLDHASTPIRSLCSTLRHPHFAPHIWSQTSPSYSHHHYRSLMASWSICFASNLTFEWPIISLTSPSSPWPHPSNIIWSFSSRLPFSYRLLSTPHTCSYRRTLFAQLTFLGCSFFAIILIRVWSSSMKAHNSPCLSDPACSFSLCVGLIRMHVDEKTSEPISSRFCGNPTQVKLAWCSAHPYLA